MTTAPPNEVKTREMLAFAWQFLKPHKVRTAWGLLTLFLASSLTMAVPWVMKQAIDDLVQDPAHARTTLYVAIIMGVTLTQCIFKFAMRKLLIGASRHVEYDLRCHVYSHLQTLPKAFFHKYRTGDIMSRVANDVQTVRMVIGPSLMNLGNTFTSVVFALVMMISIDPTLTLIAFIPLPVMPLALFMLGKRVRDRSRRVQEQMAAINTQAQENLTGVRIVKAYNLQDSEQKTFNELSMEYVNRNLSLIRVQGLFMPLMVLMSGISTVVILFFGGWWIIQDRITIGGLVAFMEYLMLLAWPMFAIGWVTGLIQQGAAATSRLKAILSEKPGKDMLPQASLSTPDALHGDLEIQNLWFRFGPEKPWVLKNISVTLPQGAFIAIMGPSGTGKTTLLDLITRTYEPTSGTLKLNHKNIQELSTYDLRETIGMMPQELILFSDTIEENLKLGARHEDRDWLEQVSRMAGIEQEIQELPETYQAVLGERGINLSGGQKQRLTLARVLARNPHILILDDPFSSVDIKTEEFILRQLESYKNGRTTIIVSHRVNTARKADLIMIIEDGEITEFGSHDELIQNQKYYWQLCRKQQIREELEMMQ